MAVWDDVISERDRQVYAVSGYGGRQSLGQHPALVVIDVSYGFTGDRREPILESVKRFRNSCGEAAWDAIAALQPLLAAARARRIPIFYSTGRKRASAADLGRWGTKNVRAQEDLSAAGQQSNTIVAEIAPQPGDIVMEKDKPSVFFGTPLLSYLIELGIDTLLVTGCTTSGCVRATVIDAFSYNYRVAVVEEATFDRGEVTHKINLFDMHAKYAEVMPLAETLKYLGRLPSRP